jgi:signal transduction histidine kinase/ActR/RegA family two-component response regulator
MRIRTLLFIILLVTAITPIGVMMGLNFPRVLAKFEESDQTRQMLLVQQDYQVFNRALERRQESLANLVHIPGIVDVAAGKRIFPVHVLHDRVAKLITNHYQDQKDVFLFHIVNTDGQEQFQLRRRPDGTLQQEDPSPGDFRQQAHWENIFQGLEAHESGRRIFLEKSDVHEEGLFTLSVTIPTPSGIVGVACLKFSLDHMLAPHGDHVLLAGNGVILKPFTNSGHRVWQQEIGQNAPQNNFSTRKPGIFPLSDGSSLALFPLYIGQETNESLWMGYPLAPGDTMTWVRTWRLQVFCLLALMLCTILFIAVTLANRSKQFAEELLQGFSDLLRRGKRLPFSWRAPRELQELSEDLTALSDTYLDNLEARKQAQQEKEALQKRLEQTNKMEAIGLMAGGVAHDLNNILAGIVGYPELLLLQLPEDSPLRESITEIHNSGQRAAAVVSDLLTIARGVATQKEPCDLNDLIVEYLDSPEGRKLQSLYPAVQFLTDFQAEPAMIDCSPIHIKKSIMNLLTNGAESIAGSGQILIHTARESIGDNQFPDQDLAPGDFILLRITDTGSGIKNRDLEHIFDPFYTKKVMGRSGTGIGLTVVWNTIKDHYGGIDVKSSKEATCFSLYFPISRDKAAVREMISDSEDIQGQGEYILVVDDEFQQRDIARKMLSSLGYQVETIASGEEAVSYMKEKSADLLVLDMLMNPGINGLQTYEEIVKIHPGQRTVIVSGYAKNHEVQKAFDLGARGFLKKPYTMAELGKAVKSILQEDEGKDSK